MNWLIYIATDFILFYSKRATAARNQRRPRPGILISISLHSTQTGFFHWTLGSSRHKGRSLPWQLSVAKLDVTLHCDQSQPITDIMLH